MSDMQVDLYKFLEHVSGVLLHTV